jgi:hypothetical protein
LHSNNSVINLIDANSKVILKKRINNTLEKIVMLLEPYRNNIESLVVESTYNWYWLVDGLMEANFNVYLANTAAIHSIPKFFVLAILEQPKINRLQILCILKQNLLILVMH